MQFVEKDLRYFTCQYQRVIRMNDAEGKGNSMFVKIFCRVSDNGFNTGTHVPIVLMEIVEYINGAWTEFVNNKNRKFFPYLPDVFFNFRF